MTTVTDKIASVAIMGRSDDEEFSPLLLFLRHHPTVRITIEYERISDALEAGFGQTRSADIAVVLQSWSDEHSMEESNQLIGRLLFGRVLCCYGSWCLADGRSHDIWPVSARVSVASAESLVAMELEAFAAGEPPLSPMSAGEEVFVHRNPQIELRSDRSEPAIFLISSERPLRKTINGILSDSGLAVEQMPMTVDAVQMAIRDAVISPRVAILDLDPPDALTKEILVLLYKAFPNLTVLGLTVFPRGSSHPGPLHAIIEKTDLSLQLRWQFRRQQWIRMTEQQ
jgi:hypothetical protein